MIVGEHGRPHLEVRGTVAGRAAQLGVTSWHISLSHDGGIASAVVVAEGVPARPDERDRAATPRRRSAPPRSRCWPRTPEGTLMQRAATGLATVCLRLLGHRLRPPGRAARRHAATTAATRCSPAPLLAGRGARVTAVLLDAGPGARGRARRAPRGPAAARCPPARRSTGVVDRADLVLDGMLGIGGRGGLRPDAAALARAAAEGAGVTVAVDVPSGVDADTGAVEGAAFPALHTVTFGAVKLGLVVGEGRGHAGQVHLVDIGLGPHLPAADRPRSSPTPTSRRGCRRRRPTTTSTRRASSASSPARRPTPAPASSAPVPRCAPGPGLVRYAGHGGRRRAGRLAGGHRHRRPARPTPDGCRPGSSGPGMGTDDAARSVLAEVLATDLPVVVDADALTLLAHDPALVRDRDAHRPC